MTVTSSESNTGTPDTPDNQAQPRRPRSKRYHLVSRILLGILLFGILVSVGAGIGFGLSAYTVYTGLRSQAESGVQHLLNVKTIFTGVSAHPGGFLDSGKLLGARREFIAARTDFQQVQYKLDHTAVIQTATSFFPQYLSQVHTARTVSQVGIDVANIGQQLTTTALILAPSFRGPLLTSNSKPLITQNMLDLVGATINSILPLLSDIQAQTHTMSIDSLPVSA